MVIPERMGRKDIRLKEYDYSTPGGYFITICTEGKKCIFGTVGAASGRPSLSGYGEVVAEEFAHISKVYPNVRLDKSVIMPNHVHMILVIENGEGGGRPKAAPTISQVVNQFKGAVTKTIGHPVWQKGFYDHIIRNQEDYLRIWEYIDTNPLKWTLDKYYTPEERELDIQ